MARAIMAGKTAFSKVDPAYGGLMAYFEEQMSSNISIYIYTWIFMDCRVERLFFYGKKQQFRTEWV